MQQASLFASLVVLSLIALFFPRFGLGFDPFVASKGGLWYLIAVTMFAIGWMLPQAEVKQTLSRWPTVLGGTAIQYTTMPLLAFFVGRMLGFEGPTLTGIVIVGCVPGAMASNVLTVAAGGNASYSVSLTTSATLLSPLAVPLVMHFMLGEHVKSDAATTSLNLARQVVLPVILGHLLGRSFPAWEQVARRVGVTVANLAILWIIAVVVAINRDRIADLQSSLLGGLLMINVGGYICGYLGGRMLRIPDGMRRALTLEIGMQNAGLGAAMASTQFGPAEALPPALYTFGCMLTGSILAGIWSAFPAETEE
jgi:BASS family bile acid:Na+ symporter